MANSAEVLRTRFEQELKKLKQLEKGSLYFFKKEFRFDRKLIVSFMQ